MKPLTNGSKGLEEKSNRRKPVISKAVITSPQGFPIGIPLRRNASNCPRIAQNCAELHGNYRACNCVLVTSNCVGNHGRLSILMKHPVC